MKDKQKFKENSLEIKNIEKQMHVLKKKIHSLD